MYSSWFIVCMLCLLAAFSVGALTLVAANRHNTHALYQLFVQRLLELSNVVLETCKIKVTLLTGNQGPRWGVEV
jgi:Mg2+/Co2+ transporter CorB